MPSIEDLQLRYEEAHSAWQQNPTQDTERAVDQAGNALRRERRAQYANDGVTNAELREVFDEDEDEQ